jgi:hypothetical protein
MLQRRASESQRDSVIQPRVDCAAIYLGHLQRFQRNPERVESTPDASRRFNPFRVVVNTAHCFPRVAGCAANPGLNDVTPLAYRTAVKPIKKSISRLPQPSLSQSLNAESVESSSPGLIAQQSTLGHLQRFQRNPERVESTPDASRRFNPFRVVGFAAISPQVRSLARSTPGRMIERLQRSRAMTTTGVARKSSPPQPPSMLRCACPPLPLRTDAALWQPDSTPPNSSLVAGRGIRFQPRRGGRFGASPW